MSRTRPADSTAPVDSQTASPQATARLRRSLPSGRACVGAMLVTIAAAGVLFAHRSASAPPSSRYLVATKSIQSGQVIQAEDLGSIAIDLPRQLDAVPANQANKLIGRVAGNSLSPSELATTVLAARVLVSSVGDGSSPDGGSAEDSGGGASGIGVSGQLRVVLSVSGSEIATQLVDAARRAEITLVLPSPIEQGAA